MKKETKSRSVETSNGREISVELTGYCTCSYCSGNWGGLTAMGTQVRVGVVATPKSIPLGSTMYIPHLSNINGGTFSVEDRGGAVVEKNGVYVIDVFFNSHQEALDFGRVKTKAYLI